MCRDPMFCLSLVNYNVSQISTDSNDVHTWIQQNTGICMQTKLIKSIDIYSF